VALNLGIEGLNRVWSGPEALPTSAELSKPREWNQRTAATPAAA
jgi:uncharacterized protein (DUF2342 family)